jgi:outer membrane protein OmpA-like peptidoglycan-associated protein
MKAGTPYRFFPQIFVIAIAVFFSAPTGAAKGAARGVVKPEKKPPTDVVAEAEGKVLRWQFNAGEILELKKFSEQVIKTGGASEKRSVFHRVLLENRAVEPAQGYQLEGTFTTLVRGAASESAFTETERHSASFHLTPAGRFSVPVDQYMPNIRSVPTFSELRDPALKEDAAMEPGTTWEKPGEEVMRFTNLVTVPFNVRYEYRGLENVKSQDGEKNCHKFIANYELNYGDAEQGGPRVFGYVTSIWFWDAAQGIPYYAQEDYNVIIVNEAGIANEFKIKSRSYYRKFQARSDAEKITLAEKLREELVTENPQISVRVTDNGVAISLPEVFFDTDSAKLSGDAKTALRQIGKPLAAAKSRHIRVRGHTDSTGDEKHNQQLSEKRAEAVADYLIDKAELNPDTLSFEGRGARDPVADNSIAEGRAKNRRVEIILLDK